MSRGATLIAADGAQSAPARTALMPLPLAVEILTAERRDLERAERVGGQISLLVPLALALARLGAQYDATANNSND